MESKTIYLKDRLNLGREVITIPETVGGLWARTEVIGSYGDIIRNPHGKSTFTMPPIFNQHNIVPVGGVSYAFQKLFEIPEKQITIPTMSEPLSTDTYQGGEGIGRYKNTESADLPSFYTPNGVQTAQYKSGHYVNLFGLGITANAENDITIYHPDYRENKISISKTNPDGLKVVGTMLPFRYTEETLSSDDRKMYFGVKKNYIAQEGMPGKTGYFLKRFEQDPVIKHIWKTGEDVEEEIPVSSADIWQNMSGLNAIESFVEIELKISHKDVKEWFNAIEQPDRCRFNTIALFNGFFSKRNPGDTDYDWDNATNPGDYVDVRMFSKLCINPEYLNLTKDLNILYRVYGA